MKLLSKIYKYNIAPGKLTDYLLNTAHHDGASKALFFIAIGLDDAAKLRAALIAIYENFPVTAETNTPFGSKFVVDGIASMPEGKQYRIRTVWILLKDADICTFVTAYPI